ncbi:MAG: glycosyltransferase family 2 protein, partial [Prevotellaceae bacterium]|nr:glycosyltransferase family 2 protein [Prevotellaceae bacterium]
MKKLISVLTPCFNEEENVEILYGKVKDVFEQQPQYRYEHIFIDNASTDRTVEILKRLAAQDKNLKIIVNARNFGHIRSPFHGMREAYGDAVIAMAADLQDPPELLPELLKKWEEGYKIVCPVKNKSRENPLMFLFRKIFYSVLDKFSEGSRQIKNFTGSGLYDKKFIDIIRTIDDPYPYFRGLVSELGFEHATVPFVQPKRLYGESKIKFYALYDIGMLGFINHSKLPLRLASLIGFSVALVSLLVAVGYFIYKLFFWESFSVGMAPMVIGMFFFSAVQLFFIGIIGEYIGAIHTQVRKR